MTLRISSTLSLPVDTVTQSVAILAKRRAGKSYTARRIAEQLLAADQQVVIIDPKGDWWGIRSGADGKSPGYPVVVLGGEHGDLPLEKTAAETIARLIVEERVSVLLDLSAFRKSEVALFLGGDIKQRHDGLLELMYRLKAREEFRTPVMLIIDEADAIAPQKPYPGEERMLGATEDIVRRGGQRGIGSLLISQRSAVVNKNVLTQTQVMIAMRTIAEQDLAAIMGWVDVHGVPEQAKILKASLPALPVGDAWILSPGWPTATGIFERIHVSAITTFDSGETPQPGERRVKPKNLADIDMAALERRMAETIERAKAEDPRELTKTVLELRKQNAKLLIDLERRSAVPVTQEAKKEALLAAEKKGFERGVKETRRVWTPLKKAVERACQSLQASLPAEPEWQAEPEEPKAVDAAKLANWRSHAGAAGPAPFDAPGWQKEPRIQRREAGDLEGPEQRVLDALADLEALGVPHPERVQVAFLAGYTNLNSKGFTNAMGSLSSAGRISYPSMGRIAITAHGRPLAKAVERPRSAMELQERVVRLLDGPCERILRALIEVYPGSLTREALGEAAGYGNLNSKGFTNAMGRLRSLGFIDYPRKGEVAALPVLFLE